VITETVYLERVNGSALAAGMVFQSRFDCSWTAPAGLINLAYRVEVWDGTTKIRDDYCSGTTYSTPAVQQGKTYTVKVFTRNTLTECATPLVGSQLAQGKLLPPGPVPSVTGQVLGGIVLLNWTPAIDLDVMRYEWRYFPNGTGTWATATLIDRVDGLTARFAGLPVGSHRFYVRAIDSVGNYSTSDATIDLTVTSDANAFLQSKAFGSPTLVNMIAIAMLEGTWTPRWETAITGDQWSTVEPSPLNSGGNAVDSYHAAGTSSWTGESWDLGTTITGDWTLTPNEQDDSGTATFALQTSPDGSTWTTQPGISWKGSTRFIRPFISTTGSMIITDKPKITLAAQSKTESGQVTTSASVGTLVQLVGQYSGAQDLQATPIKTSSPRFCVADRVLLHPQTGLMLQWSASGGDALLSNVISNPGRVIASGDNIEFDVYIDASNPAVSGVSDGGSLRPGQFLQPLRLHRRGRAGRAAHAVELQRVLAHDDARPHRLRLQQPAGLADAGERDDEHAEQSAGAARRDRERAPRGLRAVAHERHTGPMPRGRSSSPGSTPRSGSASAGTSRGHRVPSRRASRTSGRTTSTDEHVDRDQHRPGEHLRRVEQHHREHQAGGCGRCSSSYGRRCSRS
jgi:hypothetical protein